MRVAIQGEPGSNSHLAVRALLGEADLVPCALSAEVFEQLTRAGSADAAVLPIENSLHGAVADHSDLLLKYDVRIAGELSLRIRHALLAPHGVAVGDVRRVLSHPVALSQCRRFFTENRQIEAVPFYDTAGAVKQVLQEGSGAAAIAAPFAAQVYGAETLLRDLEDDPQNFTRFLLLTRSADEASVRPDSKRINKMSLAFDLPHRPGSLQHALGRLAEQGADLTRIESRPVPGRPWEYMFFVDLRVASADAADAALEALAGVSHSVAELGRYTARDVPVSDVVRSEAEFSGVAASPFADRA